MMYDSDKEYSDLQKMFEAGISLEIGGAWSHTVGYGVGRWTNTVKITIIANPDSPFQINPDGTFSFSSDHVNISLNTEGELTIGNSHGETKYSMGNYLISAELTPNVVTYFQYGDLEMKTSMQMLPTLSAWKPLADVASGYVPVFTFKNKLSDKVGYFTIENEMTYSIHRYFRDGMYVVPVVNGKYFWRNFGR